MKVFKTFAALFLTVFVLLTSSGCNNIKNNSSNTVDSDVFYDTYENNVIPIYNTSGDQISEITCFNYFAFANNGVLYTKVPDGVSDPKYLEYWICNIEADEHHKLSDVGNDAYVAFYETIEKNDHLYLSISSGEFADRDSKQTIYDIDLLEYSMSPILEIEGGIPYNSYTIAGEKLIVAELLYNGYTDLIEYDLNEPNATVAIHSYEETDYFTQGSIRHIYADDENIYTVRLISGNTDTYSLWLDIYDFGYNLVNTLDISDICVSTDIQRTEEGKSNEWKQFVAYFFVHNDLFYYQNFSTTNAIGIMETSDVSRLFDTNSLFSYAYSVSKSVDSDLFIQSWGDNTEYRNIFYLVDPQTHEVRTANFFADEPLYSFRAAFRDNNKILLTMGYIPYDEGARLPERLYYIDMNELEFTPTG